MGFDPFARLTNTQRTTRLVLLVIILLTLPCYCLGAVLLAYAPEKTRTAPSQQRPTLGGATDFATSTPSITPFRTASPTGGALQPTPLQIYLPTSVPFIPTWTLTPTPTFMIVPTSTSAPTLTLIPPLPTSTLAPTVQPTNTLAPSPAPTEVPPPTNTEAPAPTDVPPPTSPPEPSPTQEGF
jgi:hypothetical protein